MVKLDELMTELQASGYSISTSDENDILKDIVKYQFSYDVECGYMVMVNEYTSRYVVIVSNRNNGRVIAYHFLDEVGDVTFTVREAIHKDNDIGHWAQSFEKDVPMPQAITSICIGGVACQNAEEVASILRSMMNNGVYVAGHLTVKPQLLKRQYGNNTGISHKNLKRMNKCMRRK